MGIELGQGFKNLKDGRKFYAYSGMVTGGPTLPVTVDLLNFKTGLKDSYVRLWPVYGQPIDDGAGGALGLSIALGGQQVIDAQRYDSNDARESSIELFIPTKTQVLIQSLNTNGNTLQARGIIMLGWYL